MHVGLPLPRIQSERLEYGQRHYHKCSADDPRRYRFYTSLFHTSRKGSIIPLNNQTICHISAIYHAIRHISMLFIPIMQGFLQLYVILQRPIRQISQRFDLNDE